MLHKFKIILLFAFCLLVPRSFSEVGLLFSPVFAANEFSSSYDVHYQIMENGTTTVIQNIALTNLTTEYRAESYSLILNSANIENVSGFDNLGPLNIAISQEPEKTIIKAKFNDIVVGKNKILKYTLVFETTDYVEKNGQIREITLPGLPKDENLIFYHVSLTVPDSFGPALYFSPLAKDTTYTWTKEEISAGGISGTFGRYQLFDFYLKYNLTNVKPYPVTTEIALPPDTAYQRITYRTLDPKPQDVVLDADGNYLAYYNLEGKETLRIKTTGQVKIYISPEVKTQLSPKEEQKYLRPQKYWEVNDPLVAKTAKNLNSPQQIYDFVVNYLNYDYGKINENKVLRLGAKNALLQKDKAICMEFTDLFITLARAKGIPAREIDGFAYTSNPKLKPISLRKDILHAWPEYYDKNRESWVAVDPTWGKTTAGIDYFSHLDLNHFAFVVKGQNSEYPVPAGAYKNDPEGKDVEVTLAESEFFPENPDPRIEFNLPEKLTSGISFPVSLTIQNEGGQILPTKNLEYNLTNLQFYKNPEKSLGNLPPFAKRNINLELINSSPFYFGQGKVEVILGSQKILRSVLLTPIYYVKIFQIIIGGIVVSTIIFAVAKRVRRLSVQRQKEQNNLYRESEKPEKQGK